MATEPSNRWIVIFPWGEVMYLLASYSSKENAIIGCPKGSRATKLPKDAYHRYADWEFTEQLTNTQLGD